MKRITTFFSLLLAVSALADDRVFEMRIYTAGEGKLAALNSRFRDHTCKLFEKHGITNVGYWVPLDKKDGRLIYVVSYPSRTAREKSWKGFMADPKWKKVFAESRKDGPLVLKVESRFLNTTDYSPAIKPVKAKGGRVFELRTYTTASGRLKNLHARFRDHTCKIFESHDMTNVAYWVPMDKKQGADNTLVYLISHQSREQAKKNWRGFIGDPAWKKAQAASEADGKILAKRPQSVFMKSVDYSPIK
jgi:hypothetical protein